MTENWGKLSVVVPVYNVEGYLERCVLSLVRQTYRDLEIILVDDGSTDGSGAICDRFAEEYPAIRVIHKPNGGLSDARNVGMAQATGKYLAFLDADDYLHSRAYEIMLHHMGALGADLVECDYRKVYDQQTEQAYWSCAVEVQDRDGALTKLMDWERFDISVWNKIYPLELVRDLPFPVGKIHEDEFWTYRALFRAKKLIHVFFPLYFYQQGRKESILGAAFSERNYASTEALLERVEFMERNAPQLVEAAERSVVVHLFYHLNNFARTGGGGVACKKHFYYYARLLRDLPRSMRESYGAVSRRNRWKLRVSRGLALVSPGLYWRVDRALQRLKGAPRRA